MSSCSRSLLADGFRLIVVANMRCNGDAVLVLGAPNLTILVRNSNDDYEQMLLADFDRAAIFYMYTELEAYVLRK